MMRHRLTWALAATLLAALWGCGQEATSLAGGSSSEVPNATATGNVSDSSGWPVKSVRIVAHPSDYAPGLSGTASSESTSTNACGFWSLPLPRGAWTLSFLASDSSGHGWATDLALGDSTASPRHDTLRSMGWLRGRVRSNDSARVWIAGTDWQARCDARGEFLLGPLPPALLRLTARTDSSGIALTTIQAVTPVSGDTLDVGLLRGTPWEGETYSLWPHSRTAILDLTAQGAGITGDHALFPVLVRLDSILSPDTVDRSEIRFDDGTGNHLPFAIETWDSASHRAEVWVRLDTANGSSSKHFLRVFWGRRQALPSTAPEVFTRQAGFVGCWHPAAAPGSPTLSWSGSSATGGIAGSAMHLSGNGSVRLDSLGSLSQWTVGLWIRPTVKPSGEILLLGVDSGALAGHWGISLRDDLHLRVWSGASSSKELASTDALPLNAWTWISASFDGSTSRLGLVVDTVALPRLTVTFPSPSSCPVHGLAQFQGDVDEIRIADTARNTQWQKLEHQTVRPGIPWIHWL